MNAIKTVIIFFLLTFPALETIAGNMPENRKTPIGIKHLTKDFPINDLDNDSWKTAKEILIDKYWSGETSPAGRQFKAKILWSDNALYVRFEADQTEPLVVSKVANLQTKTDGLWNRDVCEIFIAPNKNEPRKYFEFEIAPNGEWIDLALDYTSPTRETDWKYNSGMRSAARIKKDKIVMSIRVEWKALGKAPKAGDIWLGNLFRCVGKDPTRGYLAWQPTKTKEPSFHVPEKFRELLFLI